MSKKILYFPTKSGTISNRKILNEAVSLKVVAILMGTTDVFCVRRAT
jgi:hypothetical protein